MVDDTSSAFQPLIGPKDKRVMLLSNLKKNVTHKPMMLSRFTGNYKEQVTWRDRELAGSSPSRKIRGVSEIDGHKRDSALVLGAPEPQRLLILASPRRRGSSATMAKAVQQ